MRQERQVGCVCVGEWGSQLELQLKLQEWEVETRTVSGQAILGSAIHLLLCKTDKLHQLKADSEEEKVPSTVLVSCLETFLSYEVGYEKKIRDVGIKAKRCNYFQRI